MASPASRLEIIAATPRSAAAIAQSPNSGSARVLKTPLTDEAMWKRLREAGFDEDSIKRRDKASLIAYIAKLEAEIYEHQHQMGLLIMENKEWLSKYADAKAAADSAELNMKCAQASHASDLAEARKREDRLKKALGIEKEIVQNIEKSLHEMRAEYAEVKVASETKFAEARSMVDDAIEKLTAADEKSRAAEFLEAEAKRYHRTAERKLHEVEEREDDLRRRILSSKSDFEAKEKEIELERQSLSEKQIVLQHTHEKLLDGQALLNQREEYIFSKTQELKKFEKELGDLKLQIDKERTALSEEKVALELKASSLTAREEVDLLRSIFILHAVIERECDLLRKEEEALLLQSKISTRESDKVQQALSNHEAALASKNSIFEAEAEKKRKLLDDEIDAKRRAWELRELDIKQHEDLISDKERELDIKLRRIEENEKEMVERLSSIEEKEKKHLAAEEVLEFEKNSLSKEKDELRQKQLGLDKLSKLLKEKEQHIIDAEEKAVALRRETDELVALELRLKEEIDVISSQKHELEAEADRLKTEKAKFEAEWELVDVKREELAKEEARILEERLAVSNFLKAERESLRAEKEALREQYKHDRASLVRDREAFMSELEKERAEWFSKIQKEHAEFLLDIEMQKKEVNYCIENRREEIENYLKEKEKEFEGQKSKELEHISSLKERVGKELEHINSEMERLDAERKDINLDRVRRDQEWAELSNLIEELKVQREKLEKQRELLRADREEILAQIETLKKLEDLKERLDSVAVHEMHQSNLQSNKQKILTGRFASKEEIDPTDQNGNINNGFGLNKASGLNGSDKSSSPLSAPFSWLKRCADSILEQRPSNKKRREENHIANGSGETTPCTPQKHLPAPNIEPAVTQASTGAETTVYIDKIITVEEVTMVNVERGTEDSKEAALWRDDENGGTELEINGKL
ncbi:nuclear matrix constituent protein 2 [Striga asiatica]|uniref:Nuclear matrix constituent protein 2 n=1 Tax=Striga asiatica TaxID=4170 RepID=A0A5A7P6R7_STRAF|nr:nuclear matrix constituent protein 2 [Striga asiatica]